MDFCCFYFPLFCIHWLMGQEFLLNRELARIVGVVKDVSVTAKDAYAQVWGMYLSLIHI